MSREIKCKWWDKEEKMMLGPKLDSNYQINVSFDGGLYLVDTSREDEDGYDYEMDVEWRQYTGLKDRNGKEIYEGDIAVGEHATYSIWWDDHKAQFKAKVEQTKSVLIRHNSFPLWQYVEDDGKCKFEIIGNIYEHPHLLGEKGEEAR